jgi:hypothetical protein
MIFDGGSTLFYPGDINARGGNPGASAAQNTAALSAVLTQWGEAWIGPGTYPINSLTVAQGQTLRFLSGGKLSISGGQTLTINGYIDAPAVQVFTGAGAYAGSITNERVFPEWWGASMAPVGGTNDDAHAATNVAALNICAGLLKRNTMVFSGMYVINASIVFSNSSWNLEGAGGPTLCGLRPSTLTPLITLYDFTGANGPGKRAKGLYAVGATNGAMGGTGFYCNGSNGIWFENCWCGGMAVGFDIIGSYVSGNKNSIEFCTVGIRASGGFAGDECQWDNTLFYANAIDAQMSGDCKGFVFGQTVHSQTTGQCFDLNGAIGLEIGEMVDTGTLGATALYFRGGSSKCRVSAARVTGGNRGVEFNNCSDCEVGSLIQVGGDYGVLSQNGASAINNRVRSVNISGSTVAGIAHAGFKMTIESGRVTGCAVGVLDGAEDLALRNLDVSANTLNFSITTTLARCESFNVTSDNFGTFVSSLVGTVNRINAIYYTDNQGRKIVNGSQAPTSGTWAVGDRITGGVHDFTCTIAGTPGTFAEDGIVGNQIVLNVSIAAATTSYAGFTAPGTSGVELNRAMWAPFAGAVRKITVRLHTAQPGDGALTFKLRVNGADSATLLTIPAGSGIGTYAAVLAATAPHSWALGDQVSISVVNASPGTGSATHTATIATVWN